MEEHPQERILKPTSVTLDTRTKALLTDQARIEDRSRSSLVRQAIIAYCERQPVGAVQERAS